MSTTCVPADLRPGRRRAASFLFSFERSRGLCAAPRARDSPGRENPVGCVSHRALRRSSMDTSKLSRNDWIVVAGMALMFVAMLLARLDAAAVVAWLLSLMTALLVVVKACLLYTSPSPRDGLLSR